MNLKFSCKGKEKFTENSYLCREKTLKAWNVKDFYSWWQKT